MVHYESYGLYCLEMDSLYIFYVCFFEVMIFHQIWFLFRAYGGYIGPRYGIWDSSIFEIHLPCTYPLDHNFVMLFLSLLTVCLSLLPAWQKKSCEYFGPVSIHFGPVCKIFHNIDFIVIIKKRLIIIIKITKVSF